MRWNLWKRAAVHYGWRPQSSFVTRDGKARYVDWWECDYHKEWFYLFVKQNLPEIPPLSFCSLFGNRRYLERHPSPRNVFFSGENVEAGHEPWDAYRDHCLGLVGLAMGFSRIEHERYLRFPLWITYVFSPLLDKDRIARTVLAVNAAKSTGKYDCALIASHDKWNMRAPIFDGLQSVLQILSAGKWRNNTDALWREYGDDKMAFLRECRFNICAENEDTEGYVTEKIFDAFRAGCIPIYAGAAGCPEPGIINPDAALVWLPGDEGNHRRIRERVMELKQDDAARRRFMQQEKLLPYAVDYVYDRMRLLKERLSELPQE